MMGVAGDLMFEVYDVGGCWRSCSLTMMVMLAKRGSGLENCDWHT